MVDLILKDSETSETLVLIRTSATFAKASEVGAAFNISEIQGLKEEDLDSQMKKDINYALDKGKTFNLAFFKELAQGNSLHLFMKNENGVEVILFPEPVVVTVGKDITPITVKGN